MPSGQQSVVYGNTYFAGNLGAQSIAIPADSIRDAQVAPFAGIDHSKLIHKHPLRYDQKLGTAVVAETRILHIAHADGVVLAIEAILTTPPTSTDTVTIDLQRGNTASGYASVLSAPLVINNSATARTVQAAAIADDDYVDGDSFQLVVTVSGTSAQGLAVNVWTAEDPQ